MRAFRAGVAVICTYWSTLLAQPEPRHTQHFFIGSKVHIRALEVFNDSVIWFGANKGVWGFTTNGGKTWKIDSVKVDGVFPQFRSIAVINDSTAFLLSIDSPAYLLKTTNSGKTWKTVLKDDRKGIFFDCLVFGDNKNGYALADPIDGCFQLFQIHDAGDSWEQIPCAAFPQAFNGEACFAASNSNMCVRGKNIWFVTGGKRSRIFRSRDKGNRFTSYPSPLPQGETMTGIYSVDFFDDKNGVISGGHYEKTDSTISGLAFTKNGGKSWVPVKTLQPFFGSCVRFLSKDKVIVTGHNGTFIVNLKSGDMRELRDLDNQALKYYTLRLTNDRKTVWLAGPQGRITRIKIQP